MKGGIVEDSWMVRNQFMVDRDHSPTLSGVLYKIGEDEYVEIRYGFEGLGMNMKVVPAKVMKMAWDVAVRRSVECNVFRKIELVEVEGNMVINVLDMGWGYDEFNRVMNLLAGLISVGLCHPELCDYGCGDRLSRVEELFRAVNEGRDAMSPDGYYGKLIDSTEEMIASKSRKISEDEMEVRELYRAIEVCQTRLSEYGYRGFGKKCLEEGQ